MNPAKPCLHNMTPIEDALAAGKMPPVFADGINEIHLGQPNTVCASCRKPFGPVRKRRKAVRLYPLAAVLPIAFSFDVCGHCYALHQQGGTARDGFLAAVEAYCKADEARQ